MSEIHPTAIIDSAAEIAADVSIGPYCIVGPEVRISSGTTLKSHVTIDGYTQIGSNCTIWPYVSIGAQTQDLKYKGGRPGVVIGDQTTIREFVTINAATFDGDLTRVGNHCHIMAYVHIAHDCIVGNSVIMANAATLAGHVTLEDNTIIGGLCAIHQFVKVGQGAITGGCSKIVMDVPPFMTADGNPLEIRGLNAVGLKRANVEAVEYAALKKAYKLIYLSELTLKEAINKITEELPSSDRITRLIDFLTSSERGITR